MNLIAWNEQKENELAAWAERLDWLPTTDDPQFCPNNISDFPAAIEKSEKLRQICRIEIRKLKEELQAWEDEHLDNITEATVVMQKGTKIAFPKVVPQFGSADKRQRELRRRLACDAEYQVLKERLETWEALRQDWQAHIDRLRRELRILEAAFAANIHDLTGVAAIKN